MSEAERSVVNSLISSATIRNWNRLAYSSENRLFARANKKLSIKTMMPTEYFSNLKNITSIQDIVLQIQQKGYNFGDALFSLSINLLKRAGLIGKKHVQHVLSQCPYSVIDDLKNAFLPNDEVDILGAIYQGLICEGEKNITGTYYTSKEITRGMTESLDFSNNQTFFDPCCGSGAFFIALQNVLPKQIFGIDNNPIAVMLAKINMLLKFPKQEFEPQIKCCDYLKDDEDFGKIDYKNHQYDYVITNPPWGAVSASVCKNQKEITSKESFSLFFVKAYGQLKQGGTIRFLFPESILNVKTHKDIRQFMLNHGNLKQISFYSTLFSGVTTKILDVEHTKNIQQDFVMIKRKEEFTKLPVSTFRQTKNLAFIILSEENLKLITQLKTSGQYTLKNSVWALGIVTGDNKNKLTTSPSEGFEKIYTGKEIRPFQLKSAKKFIKFERSKLQQVAKEEYYRAPEKLVYKFISNKLVFAYDGTGSLFLNSANILIPKIPNMSVKTVLAFLNSEVYQFLYSALFSDIKVLKGNLEELTFPQITQEQDQKLTEYVNGVLAGKEIFIKKTQEEIYKIFRLTEKQVQHIKEFLDGTFNG